MTGQMNSVYIVSAVRTPLGSFGGVFKDVGAVELGSAAIKGALERAGVPAERIQEVLMGNVVSANLGQAPARQAALAAGISDKTPCSTINKVCSSGMKSTMIAAQSILLGLNDIAVAGGMENMSRIPYYVPQARFGYKYGSSSLVDGLDRDGLQDPYDRCAMGSFADQTATKYEISREEQDEYAMRSYKQSIASGENGVFAKEIIPVAVPQRRGEALNVTSDEEYTRVKFDKIPTLRPAFSKDGTVTAANASTINDGAAALVLASEKAVKELQLSPIARIVAFADAAHEPAFFTTAPTLSTAKALDLAGLTKDQIDFYEVNEAFSVVPLAFAKLLEIDRERMNVHGGAVSLGHPLGASGARIVVTLANVLAEHDGKMGVAAICNGGGGASTMVIERL